MGPAEPGARNDLMSCRGPERAPGDVDGLPGAGVEAARDAAVPGPPWEGAASASPPAEPGSGCCKDPTVVGGCVDDAADGRTLLRNAAQSSCPSSLHLGNRGHAVVRPAGILRR